MSEFKVMFLPGIVLPAGLAYDGLVAALGSDVEAIVKDLEVYREDSPPPDYSLDTEVAGVLREADARGWSTFHLVGYSGGGAAALACAARNPARLLSLGLLEPAWAGDWDWSAEHERLWATVRRARAVGPPSSSCRRSCGCRCDRRLSCPPRHRVHRLRG